MRPDVSREMTRGWAVLAVAAALSLVVGWFAFDDGGLAEQVETETGKLPKGATKLTDQVSHSRKANGNLAATIAELKKQVGFTLEKAFEVKDDPMFTQQPGYYFLTKRNSICARLRKRAQEKGIGEFEEYAGFGRGVHQPPDDTPPKDEQAPDLLRTLQVTDKLVSTCLETPTPLQKLVVLPHGAVKPEPVAPPGRPPLFKEYRVTVDVRGSLTDILWILHRLSPGRDAAADEYPLILKSISITSLNISPIQFIPQLDLHLSVAGMSFLSDAERDASGKLPGARRSAEAGSAAATGPSTSARSF
jgi:hypothetical protein